MPIYEFYSPDNHKLYQFFARSLAYHDTIPLCPDNPAFRMQRRRLAPAPTELFPSGDIEPRQFLTTIWMSRHGSAHTMLQLQFQQLDRLHGEFQR